MLAYFKAEGYLSDLNGIALEILNCYRTYCWKRFETGHRGGGRWALAELCTAGCSVGTCQAGCRGRFWAPTGISALVSTLSHFRLSPTKPRLGIYPCFKPKHSCCCKPTLQVGSGTRQRLGWHWDYMCWSVLQCFLYTSQSMGGEERLSSLGAECCSLPSALLFLKKRSRNDGASCRYLHPEVFLPLVSESVASPSLSLHFKTYCNSREGWVTYPKTSASKNKHMLEGSHLQEFRNPFQWVCSRNMNWCHESTAAEMPLTPQNKQNRRYLCYMRARTVAKKQWITCVGGNRMRFGGWSFRHCNFWCY